MRTSQLASAFRVFPFCRAAIFSPPATPESSAPAQYPTSDSSLAVADVEKSMINHKRGDIFACFRSQNQEYAMRHGCPTFRCGSSPNTSHPWSRPSSSNNPSVNSIYSVAQNQLLIEGCRYRALQNAAAKLRASRASSFQPFNALCCITC